MAAHAYVAPARARRAALLHGIYVIVNESPSCTSIARAALDAGVAILQYRAKRGIVAATLHELRAMARRRGALLIVNDDVEAAIAYDCDGVHLGPDDEGFTDVARVRRITGDRLIGLSCGSQAEAENAGDADYLGVGSVYRTVSKDDAGEPIGIEGLRRVAAATSLPVAAIGGIDASNAGEVRASGVAMAAVIGAIASASDPAAAARSLVEAWRA